MHAMLVEIPGDPDLDSDNVEATTWKWGGAHIINNDCQRAKQAKTLVLRGGRI